MKQSKNNNNHKNTSNIFSKSLVWLKKSKKKSDKIAKNCYTDAEFMASRREYLWWSWEFLFIYLKAIQGWLERNFSEMPTLRAETTKLTLHLTQTEVEIPLSNFFNNFWLLARLHEKSVMICF